jgi:hypothetical protein
VEADQLGKLLLSGMAVLDPGKALDMIVGWEDSRLRGKTLREHVNDKIVQFVKNENFPEEDRYHLVRIFALNEFLRGVKVDELGIGGLDQTALDGWNAFNGRRIKPGDIYLNSEQVAKIDPFGVVQRPDGSAVDDLLGGDETEEFASEADEPEALRFAPKKQENRPATSASSSSGVLRPVDQQYPESGYAALDDKTRFDSIPRMLGLAVKGDPDSIDGAIEILYKVISSQPSSDRKNLNPPNELKTTFETIYDMAIIAAQKSNLGALMQLGVMINQISEYSQGSNRIGRPSWFDEYKQPYFDDILLGINNHIGNLMKK